MKEQKQMRTITHKNKEYKVQFSNLRACHAIGFYRLPGVHAGSQKQCKACIVYTLAAIVNDDTVYTGVAARSSLDQFNNKIGQAISSGRALKAVLNKDIKVRHTKIFATTAEFVSYVKRLRLLELTEQERDWHDASVSTSMDEMISHDFGFYFNET
jgi:hypothetical protein